MAGSNGATARDERVEGETNGETNRYPPGDRVVEGVGVFLELTTPLGVLGFPRTSLPEGTSIEFERTASVFDHRSVSVVVSGADVETTVGSIRENRFVEGITHLSDGEDGSVYRLTWGDTLPELLRCVRETDGTVLSAVAVEDTWTFELRFPEQGASHFYARYRESQYPITIQRVYRDVATRPVDRTTLTVKQREMLIHALEKGYFDVPRQATMVDLAREFDISDTAVSQRLRRGISAVLQDAASTTPSTFTRSKAP